MSKSTKALIIHLFSLIVSLAIIIWFFGQVLGYQNSVPGMVVTGFFAIVYYAAGWKARGDLKADE